MISVSDPALWRRSNILLMTATITPDNSPELARTDPALRLGDYEKALQFYIGQLSTVLDGIVFVENSDSDVSSLRAIIKECGASAKVEVIANYGKHSFPGRDRSLGESRLIDHAMANSSIIARAGNQAIIWKITGRYQVRNLAKMIRTAPVFFDLYCDLRKKPMPWLDLRLMAWTRQGYDRLLSNIADRIGTDPREPVMFNYVMNLADPTVVPRYRAEPLIDGVRGWDNRHYAQGMARVKYWLRSTSRTLLPFIWI